MSKYLPAIHAAVGTANVMLLSFIAFNTLPQQLAWVNAVLVASQLGLAYLQTQLPGPKSQA